ncbi:MAG: flagellar biosynthesis anti-sigma factor FlgM [Chloroflexi bacterium]|nr:flagellar biosynthesis anti-sigma factor FlgM [Chloroflexota bacterium]MBV9132678.1 flagellar biosynthesis anti-sigma factor FlgM [Chloroflexota bacterium]MBV9894014.1 flagellar biosynthesis anti-sigma factor FlgM [Chloroflexota bacterium]
MSISQINSQSLQLRAITALRNTAAATSTNATAAPARQADSVELSASARALTNATQSVEATSDVREDRVAAIKAAIANGTYSVNSRGLAHAMVRAALK